VAALESVAGISVELDGAAAELRELTLRLGETASTVNGYLATR